MAAASVARRSTHLRSLWRSTNISHSVPPTPSIRLIPMFHQARISPPLALSPSSFYRGRLRREPLFLSSLPVHSAIASARLISKLPNDANITEGIFANYVSPI